jgi:hypothetical protein
MTARRKQKDASMTKTLTITIGEVIISVREPLGMDRIDAQSIPPRLTYNRDSRRMVERAMRFADFLTRTESIVGLPFAWASIDSSAAELQAAFEGWQVLPADVIRAWDDALYEVDPRYSLGN